MIVIHIGSAKAGSSTIQKFFSDNREKLEQLGIFYPDVMGTNTHANLAWQINQRSLFNPRYKTLEDIASCWRHHQCKTMVLSSEVFEGAPLSGISRLKEVLSSARTNEEFRIIMVMRDPVDLLPSSYAQKIKFGNNSYDFDTFFGIRLSEERSDYFLTIHKWASAFGPDSIRVRPLDQSALFNSDLLDDFLYSAGIDTLDRTIAALPRITVRNIKPGWRYLEAFRALYNDTHGLQPNHPALILKQRSDNKIFARVAMKVADKNGWNDDKGLYLTRNQAQFCVERFRETVRNINALTGKRLPSPQSLVERKFIERSFLPDVSHIPNNDLEEFYSEAARTAVKKLNVP